MDTVNVKTDFASVIGPVRPMHSVGNGPFTRRAHSKSNTQYFADVHFPMARTHDAAFFSAYGGEHAVDITNIFPDFSADENDPASYDFWLTDEYMEHILETGTKVFYRLGQKIEHESKRYGALPPKDYAKWARICEHVIRHMNFGWADGHEYGIEYWEIWNEPDLHPQCWDSADETFFPLFDTAVRHLKKCFPELKIGGPAVTHLSPNGYCRKLFDYMTRDKDDPTPIDFFSYHGYGTDPSMYSSTGKAAREFLDSYGYKDAEIILNEWNYVRGWVGDDIVYSHLALRSLKGSAYIASSVIEAQKSPIDKFMYYEACLASTWNGLFDRITSEPLKGYWSMRAFDSLFSLGHEARSGSDSPDVRALAAVSADGSEAAVMISYYKDHDSLDGSGAESEALKLRVEWSGFSSENGVDAEYCLLDGVHDLEPVSYETFMGDKCGHVLELPLYATVLVRLKKN